MAVTASACLIKPAIKEPAFLLGQNGSSGSTNTFCCPFYKERLKCIPEPLKRENGLGIKEA